MSFGATSGDTSAFQPGKYAARFYEDRWYIGAIVECNTENNNAKIKLMKGINFVCLGITTIVSVVLLINIFFAQLKFCKCKIEVDICVYYIKMITQILLYYFETLVLVTFNIISHIYPENFIEIPQVVQKL